MQHLSHLFLFAAAFVMLLGMVSSRKLLQSQQQWTAANVLKYVTEGELHVQHAVIRLFQKDPCEAKALS
jgi:hypothetical protein